MDTPCGQPARPSQKIRTKNANESPKGPGFRTPLALVGPSQVDLNLRSDAVSKGFSCLQFAAPGTARSHRSWRLARARRRGLLLDLARVAARTLAQRERQA